MIVMDCDAVVQSFILMLRILDIICMGKNCLYKGQKMILLYIIIHQELLYFASKISQSSYMFCKNNPIFFLYFRKDLVDSLRSPYDRYGSSTKYAWLSTVIHGVTWPRTISHDLSVYKAPVRSYSLEYNEKYNCHTQLLDPQAYLRHTSYYENGHV